MPLVLYILLDCEDSLSGKLCFLEREGGEFMIKLPVFNQNFPEVVPHRRTPNWIWNKANNFANALLCSNFFNLNLVVPQPSLDHYQGNSLTHAILITVFLQFWPEDYQESCNKVGFICLAKHIVGVKLGTFQL